MKACEATLSWALAILFLFPGLACAQFGGGRAHRDDSEAAQDHARPRDSQRRNEDETGHEGAQGRTKMVHGIRQPPRPGHIGARGDQQPIHQRKDRANAGSRHGGPGDDKGTPPCRTKLVTLHRQQRATGPNPRETDQHPQERPPDRRRRGCCGHTAKPRARHEAKHEGGHDKPESRIDHAVSALV